MKQFKKEDLVRHRVHSDSLAKLDLPTGVDLYVFTLKVLKELTVFKVQVFLDLKELKEHKD
jgi:hypothetical protein